MCSMGARWLNFLPTVIFAPAIHNVATGAAPTKGRTKESLMLGHQTKRYAKQAAKRQISLDVSKEIVKLVCRDKKIGRYGSLAT